MTVLLRLLRALTYLALSGYLLLALSVVAEEWILELRISLLPQHDYIEEVEDLYSRGMLSEAENIANFALKNSMTSSEEELIELRDRIHAKRTSPVNRAKRLGGGFVYGDGVSAEELVGAIASDMVLYGDVRDLIKQSYFKITGKESDNVIIALSSLGIATEFVDAADWAPAMLKACRKMKCLTENFANVIVESGKKSVKTKKLTKDIELTFEKLSEMKKYAGVTGTVSAMKYVNSVDDLVLITKYSQKAPVPTNLILKSEGIKGLQELENLGSVTSRGLHLAVRAKKAGFAALCSTTRLVRRFERIVKALPLAHKLVLWALGNLPYARWVLAVFALLSGGRGLWLISHPRRRKKEKRCSGKSV